MKKFLYLGSIACALAAMAGCQSGMQMPWQKSSAPPPVEMMDDSSATAPMATPGPMLDPGLPISPQQRFKDVPVPTGMKEDFDRSYVYESPTLQIGRMVFTSRAGVNDLANFYIKEAPASGWILESALQAEGAQTLLFKKPGRRLEVRVQEQGTPRPNLLILNLTPEDSGL